MTTGTQTSTTGERARALPPVVVAVDGSEHNKAAVAWAAHEAARTGTDLRLVTVVEDHAVPIPHFSMRSAEGHARTMLEGVAADAAGTVGSGQVTTEVDAGTAEEVLLRQHTDAALVVVGRRGLGALPRLLVGSTSLALAGRSPVPVVVVPDTWHQEQHDTAPVVLGVDPYRPHDRLCEAAFDRADRLGVPLVAVHGWETPSSVVWGSTGVGGTVPPFAEWEKEANEEFDRILDGWRATYPEVEVRAVHSHQQPAMAVLDAEPTAQLLVLGRHATGRLMGFGFGSVTRAVLHYATCPVLVVPSGKD